MMKSEFESLAGRNVTDEQYKAIETLYMSSNLEKAEFVKSIRTMLKSIPQPEKKKDIKRMAVRDRSGYRKTPHPEGITSICYSCTEYETCNVKTGTCTSCDQYKNRAEAYKTEEQRYNEEQDAIDRETKKKLREQAEEEKMNNLPSDTQENGQKVHHIKLGATFFEEVASGEKTFELRKNDRDYKKGDILEMMEFKDGKNTGRTVRVLVTYILEEFAGLEDGYCIMATSLMKEDAE